MHKNRSYIRLALLPAVLLAFSVSVFCMPGASSFSFAAEKQPAATKSFDTGIYTLDSDMNFRASPSADSQILSVIPQYSVILVDRVDGVWGHTTYEGKEGWVSLEFCFVSGSPKSNFKTGKYRTDLSVNFRSTAAELKNNIIGLVPGETVVNVTAVNGEWGKISFGGESGWISLNFCSPYNQPETTTAPATTQKPAEATVTTSVPTEAKVDWLVLDISRHNAVENFDWPAIRDAGVKGVIIRVGGRGVVQHELYDDVSFYQHYLGAKAAGLHIGAYFFSYALTEAEAKEEAQMTINILRACKAEIDMPVYIDIEDYVEADYFDDQHIRAGKTVCTKVVNAFCDTVKAAGYYPGIYCNKFFAETLLNESVFNGRSLWLAHYAEECGYDKTPVDMWQYSSSGKVKGYSGQNLDVNHCYVNYPALISGKITTTEKEQQTVAPKKDNLDWVTTQPPACWKDGTESVMKDGAVYQQRIVRGGHTEETEYVFVGKNTALHAGQTFSPEKTKGTFYKKGDAQYDNAVTKIANNDGCRFTCCEKCGEILKIENSTHSDCKHDFKEHTVTVATCAVEGLTKTVCSKCGFTARETVIKRTEHTPGAMRYNDGTDGSDPFYSQFCTVCRERVYTSYNFIPGDVDGDLMTTAQDARLALRHSTKLEEIPYIYLKNADFNHDGVIDPGDARLILRRSVNLE